MAKKKPEVRPELFYEKNEGAEQGVEVSCSCGHVIGTFGCIDNGQGERDPDCSLSLQCPKCKEWHVLDNSTRGLGMGADEEEEEEEDGD